jgi:hypothetical protein
MPPKPNGNKRKAGDYAKKTASKARLASGRASGGDGDDGEGSFGALEKNFLSVTKPLKVLLDRRRLSYSVTAYQRTYEWKEEQVKTLLTDIDGFVDAGTKKLPEGEHKAPCKFLAAVVVCGCGGTREQFDEKINQSSPTSPNPGPGSSKAAAPVDVEIVDGQQRIVTAIIIYAYIHYWLCAKYPDSYEDITKEIEDRMVRTTRMSSQHVHKQLVILRHIDAAFNEAIQPLDSNVFTFDKSNFVEFEKVLKTSNTLPIGQVGMVANSNLNFIHKWFKAKVAAHKDTAINYMLQFLRVLDNAVYINVVFTTSRPMALQSFVGLNSTMSKLNLSACDVAKVILCAGTEQEKDLLCRWVKLEQKIQATLHEFVSGSLKRRASKLLKKVQNNMKVPRFDGAIVQKAGKSLFEYYLSIIRCLSAVSYELGKADRTTEEPDKYFWKLREKPNIKHFVPKEFMEKHLEKYADAFLLLTTRKASFAFSDETHRWLDIFLNTTASNTEVHLMLRALLVQVTAEIVDDEDAADQFFKYISLASTFSLALQMSPSKTELRNAVTDEIVEISREIYSFGSEPDYGDVLGCFTSFIKKSFSFLPGSRQVNCIEFILKQCALESIHTDIARALLFIVEWDDITLPKAKYLFASSIEVEHILPQEVSEGVSAWLSLSHGFWRGKSAEQKKAVFTKSEKEFWVGKFGNLTLLGKAQNNSASNYDLALKLSAYNDDTGPVKKARLIQFIGDHGGVFGKNALMDRHFESVELLYRKLIGVLGDVSLFSNHRFTNALGTWREELQDTLVSESQE